MKELPVARLGELLNSGEPRLQCIDVREPWEHETASLPGFKLYPLSRIQSWCVRRSHRSCVNTRLSDARTFASARAGTIADELDPSAPTVVLCHHGVRSRSVSEFLVERLSFADVANISGGIDAYSRRVDASVPLY